jgi:hypothetical protein
MARSAKGGWAATKLFCFGLVPALLLLLLQSLRLAAAAAATSAAFFCFCTLHMLESSGLVGETVGDEGVCMCKPLVRPKLRTNDVNTPAGQGALRCPRPKG